MNMNYTQHQHMTISAHGPVVVSAGPGAGKTRTMISRVRRFLKNDMLADEIYAMTFTKKAAGEFSARLKSAHKHGEHVNVSTIHALAYRIVRDTQVGPKVQLVSDFDRTTWARKINADEPELILEAVSRARASNFGGTKEKKWAADYLLWLKSIHKTDMDGLILIATTRIQEWIEHNPMQALIVDEFQDTDLSQWHFIKKLVTASACDFCAVGDEDQSIYGFRGAIPQVFQFAINDLHAKHLFLNDCFRSRPHIIEAANSLISQNPRPVVRKVISQREDSNGSIIKVKALGNTQQAIQIAEQVKKWVDSGIETNEIAIIGRVNQALILPSMEVAKVAPVRFDSWQNPFGTKTRRSALGLVRLAVKSIDANTFSQVLDDIGVLMDIKKAQQLSNFTNTNDINGFIEAMLSLYKGWKRSSILHPAEIIRNSFTATPDNPSDAWHNLEKTLMAMREKPEGDEMGVTFCTAHASKGQEWKAVIVASCDEDNFPHYRMHNEQEEVRILFVAMTRAKDELALFTGSLWAPLLAKDPNQFTKNNPRGKRILKENSTFFGRLAKLFANG